MSKRQRISRKMKRWRMSFTNPSDRWSRRVNISTFGMYFKYLLRKDPEITRSEIKKRAKRLQDAQEKTRTSKRKLAEARARARREGTSVIRDDKDHGGPWTGK